jgi:hypothetical protein
MSCFEKEWPRCDPLINEIDSFRRSDLGEVLSYTIGQIQNILLIDGTWNEHVMITVI